MKERKHNKSKQCTLSSFATEIAVAIGAMLVCV
jgi:hypothetical protein